MSRQADILIPVTTTYHRGRCPCGKGTVCIDKDHIPGFRSRGIMCECSKCNEKYDFIDASGGSTLEEYKKLGYTHEGYPCEGYTYFYKNKDK